MREIKIIIFDQDGTFYPSKHKLTNILRNKTKIWISKSLKIKKKELEKIYSKLPDKYPNPLDGFSSIGLKPKDYLHEVFDKINPLKYLKEDKKLKELLRNLGIDIYVVTIASKKYSEKVQNALGIRGLIKNTYSLGERYPKKKNKFEIYEQIRKKTKYNKKQILVIGDNYSIDLELANKKGYPAVLVHNKNTIKDSRAIQIKSIYQLKEVL